MKAIYSMYRKARPQKIKLLFGTGLLALVLAFPIPAMAGYVGISISLPPPIVFAAPPEVVVIPETYVYVVPDSDVDIFFYNGWWWRPWEGRWYRSRYYDSGWVYYQRVPYFYTRIPSGWRDDYRDHRWGGHQWNHQRPQELNELEHLGKEQTLGEGTVLGCSGFDTLNAVQQPSQTVQQKLGQNRGSRQSNHSIRG
jgi:hypothetical protein